MRINGIEAKIKMFIIAKILYAKNKENNKEGT